ncbi:MAG: hypothetical protein M5U19_04060 [Microthrixaceae bacterium]|nr:hypothetical protein [Microthrixaceae bacterium]
MCGIIAVVRGTGHGSPTDVAGQARRLAALEELLRIEPSAWPQRIAEVADELEDINRCLRGCLG